MEAPCSTTLLCRDFDGPFVRHREIPGRGRSEVTGSSPATSKMSADPLTLSVCDSTREVSQMQVEGLFPSCIHMAEDATATAKRVEVIAPFGCSAVDLLKGSGNPCAPARACRSFHSLPEGTSLSKRDEVRSLLPRWVERPCGKAALHQTSMKSLHSHWLSSRGEQDRSEAMRDMRM